MLKYRYTHEISCDTCNRTEISRVGKQFEFISQCRKAGWLIGVKTICPYCSKSKIKQLSIFETERSK